MAKAFDVAASGSNRAKLIMPTVMNGRLRMSFAMACQSKNWSNQR
jgi:hypothetical protein